MQTVTDNIPVVGRVTEGVGNAPVAQKIAGKDPEAEQKGYLQGAYEYVSGAGKVVYDAAGNVVCCPSFFLKSFFAFVSTDDDSPYVGQRPLFFEKISSMSKKPSADQKRIISHRSASSAKQHQAISPKPPKTERATTQQSYPRRKKAKKIPRT